VFGLPGDLRPRSATASTGGSSLGTTTALDVLALLLGCVGWLDQMVMVVTP
jgi:hypothetical protein